MMSSSDFISLLAVLISIIFGFINYRYTKRQFQIAINPVLISRLSFKKGYNKPEYVLISQKKEEENLIYYYIPTDLNLRMKNLSNTIAITGIKWKLEYLKRKSWWLPVTSRRTVRLIATIPNELDPLEEKNCKLASWDNVAKSMFPDIVEEITKHGVDGKAHKYFNAKKPISFTLRLTLSYKAGIPNAEYVTVHQDYSISSLQVGSLDERGIDWIISEDDSMIENPFKLD